MSSVLRFLGRSVRNALEDAGAMWRLGSAALSCCLLGPLRGERVRLQATMEQSVRAGYSSLPLVALICFLVGMIMVLQSAYQLQELGALDMVASLVGISMTRELAPLLTAVIVSGRVGSAIAAELGTMQVSQEVDAMKVMGIDPVSFLVVPRLIALLIALPCLTVFGDVIGILGGQFVAVTVLEMSASHYSALTLDALVLEDIYTGLVKAVAFAVIIGLVGCHQGLSTFGGADEVGRSTTAAVVRSIVLVIAADLLVTALFFFRG